jgi:hypothetical protein
MVQASRDFQDPPNFLDNQKLSRTKTCHQPPRFKRAAVVTTQQWSFANHVLIVQDFNACLLAIYQPVITNVELVCLNTFRHLPVCSWWYILPNVLRWSPDPMNNMHHHLKHPETRLVLSSLMFAECILTAIRKQVTCVRKYVHTVYSRYANYRASTDMLLTLVVLLE